MQQVKRHPRTGEPIVPVMFRKPRAHRGEIGPQPVYPVIGAADDDPDDADPDDAGRTFTQAELSAKAAKEKKEGKRAGAREAYESLGFNSAEEAKAFVDAQREAAEQQKTEAQRAAEQAQNDRREAETQKAAADAEKRTTLIERALLRKGVNDADDDASDLEDAVLLLSKDLAADADADDIAAAATALKERRPELFKGASQEPGRPKGGLPAGRPGKRKTPDAPKRGAGGLAAAQRRGHIKNTQD